MKIRKEKLISFMFVMVVLFVCLQLVCYAGTNVEQEAQTAIEKADGLLSGETFGNIWTGFVNSLKSSVKDFSSVFAKMLFVTFML